MRGRPQFRGLLKRYFIVLFMAVLAPLSVSGAGDAWFGYRDQRARLDQVLGIQADAAAARIHGFLDGLTSQLEWLVQLPWSDEPDETRRTDALRVLRQLPAVASVALLDGSGRERIFLSRIGLNRTESRVDMSADPAVVGAAAHRIGYGGTSYHRGSEPYLTVAVAGNRKSVGVVVAQVNLKLIWDVISAVRVGRTGFAFVLDGPGQLIAHPDLSLVLRGAEEDTLRPFRTIRDAAASGGARVAMGRNAEGEPIAAAAAAVPGPGWTVVVEQRLSEAYEPIYAALRRTAVLILLGGIFAGLLAYLLADRMTGPIRLLEYGAQRIAAEDFGHRISIKSGDELQRLAEQFNEMSAGLALSRDRQERIAKLRRFLAPQVAELVDRTGDDGLLEGRKTNVVVAFADLRRFTAFSAKAEPEDVMKVLGAYYEVLGKVIVDHAATLISYSGDGLMVLINAPVPVEKPGLRGADLAVAMQRGVQALIGGWRSQGYSIGFGMGVCMGSATVGRIGYESRLDYTAIGPVVNLAARLCASAADGEILVDAAVADAAREKHAVDRLGAMPIKGFEHEVEVFRIAASFAGPP